MPSVGCSRRAALALAFLAFFLAVPSHAAEVGCSAIYAEGSIEKAYLPKLWPSGFRPAPGMCMQAYIRGVIDKGDFEKVRRLYAENHPLLNVFSLISAGGSVEEAEKIGRLFRRYLISVFSPLRVGEITWFSDMGDGWRCKGPNCVCASACGLAWFGGTKRLRTVGLHRPRIDNPDFRGLAPAEAAKVYTAVLEQIRRYMMEMEAPRPTINAMVGTGSSEVQWIDADQDALSRPPSFAEWSDASCGMFFPQQEIEFRRL